MDGERISRALARIEAAANRIEAAAQAPARPHANGATASPEPADSELAGKYNALRSEAGAALAELDRLIGSLAQ